MRKHNMIWKLIGVFILICMFFLGTHFKCQAAESVDSEIVILIDASSSMDVLREEVKQWAIEAGAILQGTKVRLSLKEFRGKDDEIKSIYDGMVHNERDGSGDGFNEYAERVQNLGVSNGYTDQTGALENAINTLDGSGAVRKCIIMLSDGYLDYKNDEESKEKEEENHAKEEFKAEAERFASVEMQSIILVKFRSKDKSGVDVFTGLTGLNGVQLLISDGVESSSNRGLLRNAILTALGNIGIPTNTEELEFQNNQAILKVEKECIRVVIQIESEDNIDEDHINSIKVTNKNVEVYPAYKWSGEKMAFLHFDNMQEGSYIVTMPEGDCIVYKECLPKVEITDILLSIVREGTEVKPNEAGEYELGRDIDCILKAEVEMQENELLKDLDKAAINCVLISENDGKENMLHNYIRDSDGSYIFSPEFNGISDGSYECYIKINYGELEKQSDSIIIKLVSETLQMKPYPNKKDITVGDNINVKEQLHIAEDREYRLEIFDRNQPEEEQDPIVIDSESPPLDEEKYKFKDHVLSFKQKNEKGYTVYAKPKDDNGQSAGYTDVSYCYIVSKKSLWQRIIEFLGLL